MWLTFAVHAILCELGDLSLLSQPVPYNDGSEATVYEHLLASVNFLYGFRGLHGLIKIWGGDWNDCMNWRAFQGAVSACGSVLLFTVPAVSFPRFPVGSAKRKTPDPVRKKPRRSGCWSKNTDGMRRLSYIRL